MSFLFLKTLLVSSTIKESPKAHSVLAVVSAIAASITLTRTPKYNKVKLKSATYSVQNKPSKWSKYIHPDELSV